MIRSPYTPYSIYLRGSIRRSKIDGDYGLGFMVPLPFWGSGWVAEFGSFGFHSCCLNGYMAVSQLVPCRIPNGDAHDLL